ncbi:DUF7577 domain-containing protein [Halococcus salifodinae]|uniref:DUF7577 domain-containing protein n=1 Tax=Halococcus salifodinae TaxID=36738 RepID=UPI003F86BAC9
MGSVSNTGTDTPTKNSIQESGLIACPSCGSANEKFYTYCRECVASLRDSSQTQYLRVPYEG